MPLLFWDLWINGSSQLIKLEDVMEPPICWEDKLVGILGTPPPSCAKVLEIWELISSWNIQLLCGEMFRVGGGDYPSPPIIEEDWVFVQCSSKEELQGSARLYHTYLIGSSKERMKRFLFLSFEWTLHQKSTPGRLIKQNGKDSTCTGKL